MLSMLLMLSAVTVVTVDAVVDTGNAVDAADVRCC